MTPQTLETVVPLSHESHALAAALAAVNGRRPELLVASLAELLEAALDGAPCLTTAQYDELHAVIRRQHLRARSRADAGHPLRRPGRPRGEPRSHTKNGAPVGAPSLHLDSEGTNANTIERSSDTGGARGTRTVDRGAE